MESNTHSTLPADGLTALAWAVDTLATQPLGGLPDAVRAERVLELRQLLDRLEGQWLKELAGVDARGAAGAEQAVQAIQAGSTAGWLRARLRIGPAPPRVCLDRPGPVPRPLTGTARAVTDGQLSPAHASVLAHGTHDLPHQVTAEAEPVLLVAAARRLDPARLRQVVAHLRQVLDPDLAVAQAERRMGGAGGG